MDEIWHNSVATAHQNKLLETLQCLLTIRATSVRTAMTEAADLLAPVLGTDKVDSMFYDPSIDSLVALGSSNTVMGRRQQEIGMDRLPLANGGRIVDVFQTGEPHITGWADEDPAVLQGFTHGLGIRSLIAVPLSVDDQRLGVLHVASKTVDAFSDQDLHFLEAVARWVALVAVRAELTEQLAREAAEKARRSAAEELMTIKREENEQYLRHVEATKGAVNRLTRLTRDLMDAARLEQEVFTLSTQPVDLVQVVQETVSEFQTSSSPIHARVPPELMAFDFQSYLYYGLLTTIPLRGGESAEEVHTTHEPRILRRDDEDLAVLMPVTPKRKRKGKTAKDLELFHSAAGRWKDVDTDKLLADIYADPAHSNRPPVEL